MRIQTAVNYLEKRLQMSLALLLLSQSDQFHVGLLADRGCENRFRRSGGDPLRGQGVARKSGVTDPQACIAFRPLH